MSVVALGAQVYVRDSGGGEPVLFLHGNPDTADIWIDVIARLRDKYRCMAIDLPGFGRTKAPRDFDYSFENLGRFVDAVVENIGVSEKLNLVAHDFGGAFAMAWAAMHPRKVRRIVAINHPFFIADYKWHAWARIWRTPVIGELSMLSLTWPVFLWSIRAGSKKLSKDQIRHAYSFITREMKRTILQLYRAANPEDFAKWESRMLEATSKIPTLVLWGQHDPYIPAWIAERFNAKKVVRFLESGHWAPAEVPSQVSNELRSFLVS